ncbi:MAG: hypothetical protein EPO26_14190 [Chloroflexota bacterium]|nr:MAG: hypothetical protein EPO26_14190 [Chloroflexota bacterium]
MRYRADLHCYLCSRSAATLEWEGSTPGAVMVTRPGMAIGEMAAHEARRVRCVRCGGPTFIEEIEQVRQPAMVTIEPARRGRPRKVDKDRELEQEQALLARIA